MTDTPRRPLVAGNWKMHPPDRATAVSLARDVAAATRGLEVDIVLCPPAVWLDAIGAALDGTPIRVGAQNLHAQDSGAFTGEISAPMLLGVADHVIVGHSERRRLFGETDADVAAKVGAAIEHGIVPIVAVGESAEERRAGQTEAVITRQLVAALSGVDELDGSALVVAYEPVWAIGTGDAASGDDAQAGAALIRALLAGRDPGPAAAVRVLYGGSVAPDLASTYFGQPDIDGALVGGASLDAEAFAAIVRAAAG
jgi:triosephosphate isomerase